MIIPVLPTLNTRDQWMEFCRREAPYCFVEQPECLLDFQSTFLKITLLPKGTLIHDSIKYSLGSRISMEPVWRLIKACNWDLHAIIQGMEQMDFGSNVRDNSLLKVHTDLTVRKYFSREKHIVAPHSIGLLKPLSAQPDVWDSHALSCLISNQQFKDLRNEQKALSHGKVFGGSPPPSLPEIQMILLDPVEQCIGQPHKGRLHIFRGKQPFISLIPELKWPEPRLKKKA
ncbi:hypothetical protein [Neptuniibacter sp.]|uniref:hypothetical protein n=1 Tax=Neptuniibacter sp. TaxID=1962643 RepID=UPI00261BA5BB|nr:hypothetical protein [Neptuniibacter sp.]MCP4594943.1 hypothetical protein [Neptuniibacter sp.]